MWIREFWQLIFPPPRLCPFCGQKTQTQGWPGCRTCIESMALHWTKVAGYPYPVYGVSEYQGTIKNLLYVVKYEGRYEIAVAFGRLLGLALKEEPDLQSTQLLVPVPLHQNRMQQRGFNQAMAMAEGIAEIWRRPIFSAVFRSRDTRPQSDLSRRERRSNLRDAFWSPDPGELNGKRVLVVDDIISSGGTYLSLANLCNSCGASVSGVFLARAVIRKKGV